MKLTKRTKLFFTLSLTADVNISTICLSNCSESSNGLIFNGKGIQLAILVG